MTKPTPSYDPATICDLYQSIRGIVDKIAAMRPLPFGQFATDSDANMEIWQRHRDLQVLAGTLKGELFELVADTSKLAIARRAG